MNAFNRFYLWGADTKYRMGLYFSACVFCKGVSTALLGESAIPILILLEMLLACFAFAGVESFFSPTGQDWSGPGLARRTAVWAVLGNVIFIGCAWGLGWFPGVPVWGAALLLALLEAGLLAMWYALWLELQADTRRLNDSLPRFQAK